MLQDMLQDPAHCGLASAEIAFRRQFIDGQAFQRSVDIIQAIVQARHILPESGWISFYLREDGDVEKAVALLRQSFEIAIRQKSRKNS